MRRCVRATQVAFVVLRMVAGLALPSPLQSQAPAAPATLENVVAVALRHNPDIAAARLRADSAMAERRIARAIPNPVVASSPNQPWQYTATMPLDVTPQRVLRTRAAGRGADAARDDAADTERQVIFAVRAAFYDVLLAEQLRAVAGERRDVLRQLLVADSVRLRAGDVPPRNVTRSELELARAEADVTRAVADVHAARLALQLLMGVTTPDTAFTVQGALVYRPVAVPDSLMALALGERPDVRAARERVAQSEALRRQAGTVWIPTPVITLAHSLGPFGSGDLFDNGTRNAIGVALSVPLFDWNGGGRQRSEAGLQQTIVNARRVEAGVANDVATALDGYQSARGLAERYESGLLARAGASLETSRYAYATGAVSQLELLDALRTYSDTRADYDRAVHDYWISVFALGRAIGKDLGPQE